MKNPIRSLLLAAALAAALPLAAQPLKPATPAAMNQIYADYWEEFLQANPVAATFNGDNRFNDRFGATTSAEGRAQTKRLADKYLALTAQWDPSGLPAEDRISYDLLRYRLQQQLEGLNYPSNLVPLNQSGGLHLTYAQLGSGRVAQPFATVKDYDNWLARAASLPAAMDGQIADMRKGMAQGVVLPRPLAAQVLPQLQNIASGELDKNVYLSPIKKFPDGFSDADKARLTAAYTALVRDQLVPAYQRLLAFMRDTYLPATRDTVGLSALPDGKAWYAFQARSSTTTALTPEEIHTIGLNEVARIRALFEQAKDKLGFKAP